MGQKRPDSDALAAGRVTPATPTVEALFDHGESPVPHMRPTAYHILRWETAGIELATVCLFWMPFRVLSRSDPASMPGFTTRAEVGRELARDARRLVLGMPPRAEASGHIRYHAHQHDVKVWETLEETLAEAVRMTLSGATD